MPEYFVEMNGLDTNDGKTPATAWKSVKWAVSAAAADSTINIGKGTFIEAFEIKKNLLLRGAGQTETTIECPKDLPEEYGPMQKNPPSNLHPENFTLTQMIPLVGPVKVRFENLRVNGYKKSLPPIMHVNGVFAADQGAHLEVESCSIVNFAYCHILVLDGKLTLSNSKVGTDMKGLGWNSDLGIVVCNQTKATITNCELGNKSDHCVDVYHNANVEVIHCTIKGSDTINCNGVRVRGTSTTRIAHCTITGQDIKNVDVSQTQAAIQLWENARADIHDNHLSGFDKGLLFMYHATARVWSNTITNNFNFGVDYSLLADEMEQPDLGGGHQGSPGENVIKDNGSLTGYDIRLKGQGGTCYARFNEWSTTDVMSRVKVEKVSGLPPMFFDFLPLKQIPQPEPLDSMLLLDQSGSMLEEGKWDAATSGVNVFSTALAKINCNNSDLKLGLMTFAKTETESTHLWKPLAALSSNPAHLADGLSAPHADWMTPLGKGLLEAKKQLEPLSDGRRKYIFLLSDGKNNTGTPPVLVYPGFEQRVNVYSVGFGDDSIDPEMLSEISDGTLGDYYLTGSTDNLDLKRFYLYSLATPLGISIVINTREEGVTTFPINEGEGKMLVMIGWEAAGLEVDFDLRDSKGTLITPQSLPTGCTYQTEADASFAGYTVENPVAGAWQLLNVRRKDNGPQPEVVRFVALDPNVVAQFGVDRAPGLMGNKLRLYARLMENGTGLEASVKVKITSPAKSIGTLVTTHMTSERYHVAAITRGLPAGRPLQRSDILKDYKQQHQLRVLPTVEGTAELRGVRHPSETEKSTGYFQTEFTPTEEGTYTFEFEAEGVTGSNQPFRRTYTLSKYVSFMADPQKTNVVMTLADDPSLIRQGLSRYKIIVTPVSANGNLLGPFNASKIFFSKNGHPLSVELKDLMNGSYEAYLLLKKEEDPREVRLRIGDRKFPQPLLASGKGCLALLARLFR